MKSCNLSQYTHLSSIKFFQIQECFHKAKLYGLPKIHKLGTEMRLIISNIGAPNYTLATLLTKKFNKFPKFIH